MTSENEDLFNPSRDKSMDINDETIQIRGLRESLNSLKHLSLFIGTGLTTESNKNQTTQNHSSHYSVLNQTTKSDSS